MVYLLITIIVTVFIAYFSKGFLLSTIGGISVSSTNKKITLKGKILSVSYNNIVVFGNKDLAKIGSNTISQSNNGISLQIKGGHANISGLLDGLTVNGKNIQI